MREERRDEGAIGDELSHRTELAHVGLELRSSADPAQVADGASAVWLGVTVAGTKVTGVLDGSPAQLAGISPGDELVAIDRFQVATETELPVRFLGA